MHALTLLVLLLSTGTTARKHQLSVGKAWMKQPTRWQHSAFDKKLVKHLNLNVFFNSVLWYNFIASAEESFTGAEMLWLPVWMKAMTVKWVKNIFSHDHNINTVMQSQCMYLFIKHTKLSTGPLTDRDNLIFRMTWQTAVVKAAGWTSGIDGSVETIHKI